MRLLFAAALLLSCRLEAQAPASDSLLFANGDQLTGVLERADKDGVSFKSSMAGEITVKWENIRELRSDKNFAVFSSQQKLTRKDAAAIIPQGKLLIAGKQINVETASGAKTIPIADADRIVDAAAFDKALNHPPGLLRGWAGTASAGASLVRATQKSTSFNGAISLLRATPSVEWLPPRNRTTLDYLQSYGTVSQTGDPTLKTNIFHAAAEQDEYLTRRLFAFGSATFDHNFSQTLDLSQAYGAGLGITLLHNPVRQFDLKGDAHYEKQHFFDTTHDQNLFGSTFSERYLQYLPKSLVFTEFGSISPSWNNTRAYSAHVNAALGFPIYRGIGFSIGAVDDYLNDAPIGTQKNTTQFTSGITYTIKPR